MPKTLVTTVGLIATLLMASPSLAVSKNVAESFMVLDGSYPESEHHVVVVPSDITSDVHACVGTAHDRAKFANEGYNVAKITISRTDSETGEVSVEKHGKRGSLNKSKWLRCIQTGPINEGDMVEFWYEFTQYRRPRGATIHVRSTLSEGRMLISELRGIEAQGDTGVPTQYIQRVSDALAENGKHAKSWRQAYAVHADSIGKVQFCAGYGNTIAKKPNTGSAEITVNIDRTDADTGEVTTETHVLEADVVDNRIRKCVRVDPVQTGDPVVVDVKLKGFPRLRGNAKVSSVASGGEAFEIKTGIGPSKMLASELLSPAPEPAPDTGGGGGGGTPTDTSQVSASEQRVISALAKQVAIGIGTRERQKGNITWLIAHRYSCATNFIEAASITAVYDKYVKACGNRGVVGGALSKSDLAAIAQFKKAFGTTGLRWEAGGRVIGEYYTPATDTVHKTFKTIPAAVAWLKSQRRFN